MSRRLSPLGLPPKIRLAPLWPALAAVLTTGLLLWQLLPNLYQQSAGTHLLAAVRLFAPIVGEHLADPPAKLEAWVRGLAADRGLRVTLITADGRVLADSARTPEERQAMASHAAAPEFRDALAKGQGVVLRRSVSDPTATYLYAARPMTGPGGQVFVLRFAEPLAHLGTLRKNLALVLALAMAAAGVVILLSSLWLDRRFFRPLGRLIAGAGDLAQGRRQRVDEPEVEELAVLSRALNRLAETAERQFAAVRSERDHLQSILASMSEGVLVVGQDGRVSSANAAFRQLFDLGGEVVGRPVLEISRHPELGRVIEATLHQGAPQSGQMEIQVPERRTLLLASAALSGGDSGAVVVARDTTELTRVADMRRDFVANVSHELKTPLAAIRGYAETLRDGALEEQETARRFTDRLIFQCRRLQALLDDLLTLSRLESVSPIVEREPVDLSALAQRTVEMLAAAAREKRIRLEVRDERPPRIPGDADGLERLLVNLLDNAIKYNKPGGEVLLRLASAGGQVLIEVSDTGIGIPQDALSRIFERFYRVDKGRAREEGGTGLGLAIVKHLAQSHGGQVEVESRMGRGTTFRVRLPAAAAVGVVGGVANPGTVSTTAAPIPIRPANIA